MTTATKRSPRKLATAAFLALGPLALGCGGSASNAPAPAATATPATISRDDFRKAVMGKTPDEVLKAVGKPDSTSEDDGTGMRYWHYRHRTVDAVTGKTDASAQVVIERGRVTGVNY